MTMEAIKHLCLVVIISWLSVVNGKEAEPVVDTADDSKPADHHTFGTGSDIDDRACKKGFIRLTSGKCYLFVSQVKSWSEALASCRGVGTTLAYPMNVVEASVLTNYLMANYGVNGCGANGGAVYGWYLGGTDQAQLGHWLWAHNNASLTYFDWTRDQPDSPGGDERCLQYFDSHWQWNNVNCNVLNPFICQQL